MMDNQFNNEKQLLADIDHLREQFPQTQDLYREVCTLLFFRYGMTPTANKLYQLVRKGSMTAPADALTKFWEDLREKSRVRIEHPDLPESLKTAAGELTAVLWSSAQTQAQETLAAYRQEARAALDEALTMRSTADSAVAAARSAADKTQQDLQQAIARCATLEQQLAGAAQNAEAALGRERQGSARLQHELDSLRATSTQAAEKAAAELAAIQLQLGDARQNVGVLEGRLAAVSAQRDELTAELHQTRDKLREQERELGELRQVQRALPPTRTVRSKISSKIGDKKANDPQTGKAGQ
jgi:chromosome segregation ATPase